MRVLAPLLGLALLVTACGDSESSEAFRQGDGTFGLDVLDGEADGEVAGEDAVGEDTATVADTAEAVDTAVADTEPSGPTVTIKVSGSLEDRAPADGLASQTPSVWEYGLQRLELLRSEDDPSPEVIFDYAPGFVTVDLLDENVVARVPIANLPEGSFPYFRIVLTHAEVVVAATLHEVPVISDYATDLDIVYALSDVDADGLTMSQGDVTIRANIFGTDYEVPTHWPTVAPSPGPNAWAEAVDGEWRVTFAASPAVVPSPQVTTDVTYAITFYVANAFRWQDQTEPGYAEGVWDLTVGPPAGFEPVERFGANAYEVYYEGP
ncbi:MAG: hypothetical protein EP329_06445 [Deltaproteobacteria bacterium]|nr:MAG: hypothetical protein EP329_06445 [Deltaproteobacteria bacterium]